jgi:hypothetical protein
MSRAAEQGLVETALPEVVALIEVVCATLVVAWWLVPTVSDIAGYSFDQETGDTTRHAHSEILFPAAFVISLNLHTFR